MNCRGLCPGAQLLIKPSAEDRTFIKKHAACSRQVQSSLFFCGEIIFHSNSVLMVKTHTDSGSQSFLYGVLTVIKLALVLVHPPGRGHTVRGFKMITVKSFQKNILIQNSSLSIYVYTFLSHALFKSI